MRVAAGKPPTRTSHMRLRTYYRLVWEDDTCCHLPPEEFSDVDDADDDSWGFCYLLFERFLVGI